MSVTGTNVPPEPEEGQSALEARVAAWQDGKNLQAMLASLHEVAPRCCRWQPMARHVTRPSLLSLLSLSLSSLFFSLLPSSLLLSPLPPLALLRTLRSFPDRAPLPSFQALSQLIDEAAIKDAYKLSLLAVHPDKLGNRPAWERARCQLIFNALRRNRPRSTNVA